MGDARIAWVDVETTGLDPTRDAILELGCVVTDEDLAELARASWVLACPSGVLARMEPKVREMHIRSGLLDEVKKADLYAVDVKALLNAFLDKHAPVKPTLAGSSVHFDKSFLECQLDMRDRFHHRLLDVSVLRVIAWQVAPHDAAKVEVPRPGHRALDDIMGSMRAYGVWRRLLFKPEYAGPQPAAIQ